MHFGRLLEKRAAALGAARNISKIRGEWGRFS
jgi:hypothetical protein